MIQLRSQIFSISFSRQLATVCPLRCQFTAYLPRLSNPALASHIVSYLLPFIINKSVETAIYPSKLKHAKVILTFKNDEETIPSNYRPTWLLSIFNRIFETLMYNRLKAYLGKQGVFYKSQYGVRDKHSTQHAILDIMSQRQKKYGSQTFLTRYLYRSTKGILHG